MAMNKQALAAAQWFLLYCFLLSLSSECSSENFYTVGVDTFRIQEEGNFNASTSLTDAVGLHDKGRGEADLTLTYLQPTSNSSWIDIVLLGLERDKRLVNYILAGAAKNKNGSSILGLDAFNVPVQSGNEIQGPEYTVTVGIGTPSVQQQLMGIDSLSSLSWIQCYPCRGCSSKVKLPMYVPQKSSSLRSVQCRRSKCPPLGSNPQDLQSRCNSRGVCTYTDINGLAQGSQGEYFTDTLRLGRNTIPNFYMGCARGFSQAREDGTSGRLGLGRGPLSLVSQAYGRQFSYCLPNYLSVRATGSLRFGEGSIPSSVRIFTPMRRVSKFFSSAYVLGLKGISIGGRRLRVRMQVPGALPTITYIDTTLMATRFVKPVYQALRDTFERRMKRYAPGVKPAQPFGDFRPCYQLSSLKSVRIPIITLHFKGNANVNVPVVGTLLQVAEDVVCFPFLASDNDSVNIIGNVQQQGLRVAFDNVRNRVGFSRESC